MVMLYFQFLILRLHAKKSRKCVHDHVAARILTGWNRITYQQLRGYLSYRSLTMIFISRKHLEQTQVRDRIHSLVR